MARYFKNVDSLEQLRKQYRDLLKQYHPDNVNGSTEATQEINAEYDQLFKVLKDKHESKSANNSDTATAVIRRQINPIYKAHIFELLNIHVPFPQSRYYIRCILETGKIVKINIIYIGFVNFPFGSEGSKSLNKVVSYFALITGILYDIQRTKFLFYQELSIALIFCSEKLPQLSCLKPRCVSYVCIDVFYNLRVVFNPSSAFDRLLAGISILSVNPPQYCISA